jgi:hypothetical protein
MDVLPSIPVRYSQQSIAYCSVARSVVIQGFWMGLTGENRLCAIEVGRVVEEGWHCGIGGPKGGCDSAVRRGEPNRERASLEG